MRINKYIASCGVASRRKAEEIILDGRVTVNGNLVTELAFNIDEEKDIVEIDGKKVGVYKNNQGEIYKINPVCKHLGCELTWNNLDKTWDCPCHGSRYDYKGKLIYGPSVKDL